MQKKQNMSTFNLSSTTLNDIQNHDDYRVVWFSLNKNLPDGSNYIRDYLEICHSFDACDKYIKNFKSEHKILLVLIELFEHASYFVKQPQIQSIYILKTDNENQNSPSKFIHIFDNEQKLIEKLRQDILLTYRNDFGITKSHLEEIKIELSLINLGTSTSIFLWNQLLLHYLVHSPYTDEDMHRWKDEMIKQCRLDYPNDVNIDHFANDCTLGNVLECYTKPSFVF